jgi:hypothetical protein
MGEWAGATEARWVQLTGRLRVPDLVEQFVVEVSQIWPYSEGVVPRQILVHDAHGAFERLLRTITGADPDDHLASGQVPATVGRDRARRGVALESVMAAIRLDFAVVWSQLRAEAGADDLDVLVSHVESLWRAVETYASQTQRAYLEERAMMAREATLERRRLVEQLLAGPVSERLVEQVAIALDVPVAANLLVCAAASSWRESLWRCYQQALGAGRRCHWHETGGVAVLVMHWQSDESTPGSPDVGGAVVVAPIARGVAALPRSMQLAGLAARALVEPPARPLTLRECWVDLVADQIRSISSELIGDVLAGLEGSPSRQQLEATLRTFLATGSVTETARAGFCHRNTVQNRLRRCHELTGLDPLVPEQATVLVVALACQRAGAARAA